MGINNPKVSICIPVFRDLKNYLFKEQVTRCLNSIFTQKYEEYEVIITDDTVDNSGEIIINEIVKKHNCAENLKYFKNNERKGSPENWNEAIRLASGNYIKILHQDDWLFDENSLNHFVRLLDENLKVSFAFCSSAIYDLSYRYVGKYSPSRRYFNIIKRNPDNLFFYNLIGAPSATIYKRELNLEFDPQMKWLVDVDFYIRLLVKNNGEYKYDSSTLISTQTSPSQITASVKKDKNVNLYEHFYLYNKLVERGSHNHTFFFKCKSFILFLILFLYFDVERREEIISSGYQGSIPKWVSIALFLNASLRPILKYLTRKYEKQLIYLKKLALSI